MVYIEKFYERNFRAESPKEAYMKACKFVASNVVSKGSKVEAKEITWDVMPVDDNTKESLPTFRLTLYYKFDDTEFMKMTCNACKEFHKSFFINENFNCSTCNKTGYEKNVRQTMSIGLAHYKKQLDDEIAQM